MHHSLLTSPLLLFQLFCVSGDPASVDIHRVLIIDMGDGTGFWIRIGGVEIVFDVGVI